MSYNFYRFFGCLTLRCPFAFSSANLGTLQLLQYASALKSTQIFNNKVITESQIKQKEWIR